MKKFTLILLVLVPFLWASFASPPPAFGATITVTTTDFNTDDDGECSIIEAIANANSNSQFHNNNCIAGDAGLDTITFDDALGTATITFTNQLNINSEIVIDGGSDITLSGGNTTRILQVNASESLTLQNITLRQGNGNSGSGGAILVDNGGTLTVQNSNFNNNDTPNNGGAINSSGTLDIENTVFQNNGADGDGGAIYQSSNFSMTIETSAFIGNNAGGLTGGNGGAIFHNGAFSAPSSITASYFVSNTVNNADNLGDGGGAIYHGTSGVLAITASAFFDNSVLGNEPRGGAIYNNSGDDFAMTINYSHFGTLFSLPVPGGITINGVDITALAGFDAGNYVSSGPFPTVGGGAIYNNGYLLMTGSSVIGNSARLGGGLRNDANSTDTYPQPLGQGIIIANSTFANNSATVEGGAIYHGNTDDLMELVNVTIANNTAPTGDGIFNAGDGESPNISPNDEVYLVNVIIANDSCAGGSLGNGNGSASGNNVVFGGTCDIRQQDGSSSAATFITADPFLSAPELAFTPATVFTVVLSLGTPSSASGTGDNSVCTSFPVLSLDQRIFPRPQGDPNCDIGAYESSQTSPQEINVRDGGDTTDILDGATPAILANGTDFGTTPVGTPVANNFIIQNTGGSDLTLGAITIPTGFSITTTPSSPVAGGADTILGVTCNATTAGTYSGEISIPNNDSDEDPYNFAIICVVEGPEITVTGLGGNNVANGSAASLVNGTDFGTIPQSSPLTRTFTIENTGVNLNLDITSIAFVGAGMGFNLVLPTLPDSIAPTNSITFDVTCLATSAGLFTETITIANNDSNENPFTFAIRCNVTPPATPLIEVFGLGNPVNDGGGNSPALANGTDTGLVGVGSVAELTFTITNNGTVDLTITNIIVSGVGFTLVPGAPTSVGAGMSETFAVACDTSAPNSFSGGSVTIENNSAAPTDVYNFFLACVVALADVRVSKADNTDPVPAGSPLIYTVSIENLGTPNVDAIGVDLTEVLPLGFTATAISTSQGTCPATPLTGTFNCNIGTIGASVTASVVITGTFDPSTPDSTNASNEAYVNYTGFSTGSSGTVADADDARAVEETVVVAVADVGVSKTVNNPTPVEGGTIVYTIEVENFGPSTATGVVLTDSLPTGVTGTGFTGTGCSFTAPTLSCPIGTMLPGDVFTATITAEVDTGASALSPITNTANIVSTSLDTNGSNDSDDVDINATAAAPEINLRNGANTLDIPTGTVANGADGTDFGTTTVGTPVTRSFIIQNTGTSDLSITVDPLPAGFTVVTSPLTTIPATSSTTLTIECTAAVASLYAGNVTIPNNDSDENPYTFEIRCQVDDAPEINVQGNGVDIANGDFTPSPTDDTDFGATLFGVGVTRQFIIQNVGSQSLNITGAVTITNPTNFNISAQPAITTIPPPLIGNETTFDVTCTAANLGTHVATVSIPNDDSDENPFTFDVRCEVNSPTPLIEVRGNGVVIPDGVIAPNLGDHTLFVTTSPGVPTSRTFEIRNIGTGNLTVSISGTPLPVPFDLTTAPSSPVTNGNPTTFTIECNPPANGNYPLTITIDNNDTTTPGANPYTFGIECVATMAGVPEIDVFGNNVEIISGDPLNPVLTNHTNFGSTSVGIPITRTFTIENTGLGDLTIGAITVPTGFTISTTPAAMVTSGNSTTLGITCDASAQATYGGPVSIVNNDSDENPYEFAIRCIVNPAGSPADLSLSKIVSDTTPQFGDPITYTVTVTNVGPGATTGVQVVDILPTSTTFIEIVSFDGTSAVLGVDNFTNTNTGLPAIVWDIGALSNPQTATLVYRVTVNPTVGTTTNYAQVTASTAPDPNSQPNNGTYLNPIQDDEAAIAFLFDPPFGRKSFVFDGVNVLEWTIIWVNPSNNPIPVQMSDPLLGGTTFVPGSLVCTPFGSSTQTTCVHDPITNTILFEGIIAPNPGATVADTLTASNRLEIVYRVVVPEGVSTVANTATLTDLDSDVTAVVTETFTRTITPPPTTGGMTTEEIQAAVKTLPATGETPLWADVVRWILLAIIVVIPLGVGWYWRGRLQRQ